MSQPFTQGPRLSDAPVGDPSAQAIASLRGYAYQLYASGLAWLDLQKAPACCEARTSPQPEGETGSSQSFHWHWSCRRDHLVSRDHPGLLFRSDFGILVNRGRGVTLAAVRRQGSGHAHARLWRSPSLRNSKQEAGGVASPPRSRPCARRAGSRTSLALAGNHSMALRRSRR